MPSPHDKKQLRANSIYHVFNRSWQAKSQRSRPVMFRDDVDRATFLDSARKRVTSRRELIAPNHAPRSTQHLRPPCQLDILSYALMPTHFHFIIRQRDDPNALMTFIHALSTEYARNFHARHGTKGQLFEHPYEARIRDGADDVINTIAYIHLNPRLGPISTTPTRDTRERWTSHANFMGWRSDRLVNVEYALSFFGDQQGYEDFVNDTDRVRRARLQAVSRQPI